MMIIGTPYFESYTAACIYYKPYGYNQVDVKRKIKEQEIYIGKPVIKENEVLFLNNESRYCIQTKEKE